MKMCSPLDMACDGQVVCKNTTIKSCVPACDGEVHRVEKDYGGGPGQGTSTHVQTRLQQVEEDTQRVDGMQGAQDLQIP